MLEVGWSRLHAAAANGDLELVRDLLRAGADVQAKALDGCTPLVACESPQVIEVLLAAGAGASDACDDGWDAVTAAALRGDARSLTALYAAGARPTQDQAAWFLHKRLGARLLEAGESDLRREEFLGLDPVAPDIFACAGSAALTEDWPQELTPFVRAQDGVLYLHNLEFHSANSPAACLSAPFHLRWPRPEHYVRRLILCLEGGGPLEDLLELAAGRGEQQVVETLLARHPGNSRQALLEAVKGGRAGLMEALLPGCGKKELAEALRQAARHGQVDLLGVLVKAGANPNPALLEAADSVKQADKVVARLLKLGAEPDWADRSGRTALMLGADRARADIVKRLLKAGADPNRLDQQGRNALHYALDFGRVACVEELIVAGIFVNQADREGLTPLHVAVASPTVQPALIELLLTSGADPHLEDAKGQSPGALAQALWRGYRGRLA